MVVGLRALRALQCCRVLQVFVSVCTSMTLGPHGALLAGGSLWTELCALHATVGSLNGPQRGPCAWPSSFLLLVVRPGATSSCLLQFVRSYGAQNFIGLWRPSPTTG